MGCLLGLRYIQPACVVNFQNKKKECCCFFFCSIFLFFFSFTEQTKTRTFPSALVLSVSSFQSDFWLSFPLQRKFPWLLSKSHWAESHGGGAELWRKRRLKYLLPETSVSRTRLRHETGRRGGKCRTLASARSITVTAAQALPENP